MILKEFLQNGQYAAFGIQHFLINVYFMFLNKYT